MSSLIDWLGHKLTGWTGIDKALAAFFGSMGIQLDWTAFLQNVDLGDLVHTIGTLGWKQAALSLIPAIATYIANNKSEPSPATKVPESERNFNKRR